MQAHQPLRFLLTTLLTTMAVGCVVGTEDMPAPGTESDSTELPELPASIEEFDPLDDVEDRLMGGEDEGEGEVGQINAEYALLINPSFDQAVYYSGSNFRRWRVSQGVTGNHVYRSTRDGRTGLVLNCIDLCFAKQRTYANPGQTLILRTLYRGYANDGSPRQRIAIWFYDMELKFLGGRHEYIEDSSGAFAFFGVAATAPANTRYAVAEVMYDSSTNERSRYWYDGFQMTFNQ